MYKGNRRKEVCRLFGHQRHMHIASWAPQLPPGFEFTFTLLPENEKPLTAKTYRRIALPPNNYRRIALPPKNPAIFWFTASAKVVTAEKRKTSYRQKITAVLHYHRKNSAISWFTASTKVVTAKNEKTAKRLKLTAVWQYRPAPPVSAYVKKTLPTTTLQNLKLGIGFA